MEGIDKLKGSWKGYCSHLMCTLPATDVTHIVHQPNTTQSQIISTVGLRIQSMITEPGDIE